MALSPDEIERRDFSSSLRGFDKTEVRDFLRRVARDVGRIQTELNRAQSPSVKLREAQEAAAANQAAAASDPTQVIPPPPAPPQADPTQLQADPTQLEADSGGREASNLVNSIDLTPQTLDADDDRFEALGERIAGLLRTAHTSAAQLKENAEAEAAGTIKGAHAEAEQIRRHAEEEIADLRAEAERAGEQTRALAATDADRLRVEAEAEVQASHEEAARIRAEAEQVLADAHAEAERVKNDALAAGQQELDERERKIAEAEAATQADREAAMSELVSAREQVAGLLGEARSQSDFIRHEAEEIIRAKIRSNVDQAEQRLTMLRNSEVASRERIARAHQELTGALARLDAETAPALPENPEHAVLEEAYERGEASGYGETDLPPLPTTAPPMPPIPAADGSNVVDPRERETQDDVIEIAEVFGEDHNQAPDTELDGTQLDGTQLDGTQLDGTELVDTDVIDTDVIDSEVVDTELIDSEVAEVESGDIAEAVETDEITELTFDDDQDIAAPQNPLHPTEPSDLTEPPFSPEELVATPVEFGEEDLPPVEVPENEDALARLVREAMQRAVDSARSPEES